MNWWLLIPGALAAVSAVGVVWSRQALNSALSLIVTIISFSVIFLMLNAQFLFAVQIIVYAGAIMVLFVFIIALLNPRIERRPVFDWRMFIGIASAVLSSVYVWRIAGSNAIDYPKTSPPLLRGYVLGAVSNPASLAYPAATVDKAGNIQTIGGQLFTTYLLPFEVTSLLLLVAAAGAVYLTSRRKNG